MQQLLALLDKELVRLRDPANDPDYHLLLDIARFFTHFPDIIHHQAENELFVVLAARRGELEPALQRLIAQHRDQTELAHHLFMLLEGACAGHLVSRAKILEDAEKFIALQNGNIRDEEEQIFPRCEAYLEQDDWHSLEARVETLVDPAFEAKLEAEYSHLFIAINEAFAHSKVA